MYRYILPIFLLITTFLEGKLPQLTPEIVNSKVQEIMKAHATYKSLNTEIIKRTLSSYIEELDPNKTYFLESDIKEWIHPSDSLLAQVLQDYNRNNFSVFFDIHEAMIRAIERRKQLDKQVDQAKLPTRVNIKEFKDMKWARDDQELIYRLERIKALQIEASMKLDDEVRDKALLRIEKRQSKTEQEIINADPTHRQQFVLTNVLKATASALDAHTAYFTPDEAAQFMINVQQRLSGIGVQLRDDINGFTVVKIIEGGPAALEKGLKVKDRIIAVNGEPVVGMEIGDAVELIRGVENTPVVLTVIRETKDEENGVSKEEKKDITIKRGEVVLKESRFTSSYEPFGDGVIAYLKLFSFYQDQDSSSATDLAREIEKLKKDYKLEGVILDLRFNTGGLLSQAVDVAGLFITKGIVVSVKDHTGSVQHLRDLDGKTTWDGPLIVLVNRASASASEIVAQSLQDYGRALIVGDDHTYGKGTFQTFTLNTSKNATVDPTGEYKVTRGKYYTVSGKTPQLNGVISEITVPGTLSQLEIGEKFAKYPLENDHIKEDYDDDLSDIPFTQRNKVRMLYKFDLQKKLYTYIPYLDTLRKNSSYRIDHDKNYQSFLQELKKDDVGVERDSEEQFGQNDLQLTETFNIMKDLILLMQHAHEPAEIIPMEEQPAAV